MRDAKPPYSDDTDATLKPGAVWRVEMLGGLRVLPISMPTAEAVEQFRTHKTALILARLALSPHRAHGREELADLLWPDLPPERGRANLTQTLAYLRQALREPRTGGLFITDHKTVRVRRESLQTDVAEWASCAKRALAASEPDRAALLTEALDAYSGDLLPGFYDDWVCDERSRLAALRDELQAQLSSLPAAPPVSAPAFAPAVVVPDMSASLTRTVRNAPLYLTRYFGREAERAEACRLLRHDPPMRLLTLLGMGGIGKTRLAFEIGQAIHSGDNDRPSPFGWAAFVSLAEARTGAQMESILLHALGIPSEGANGMADVTRYLQARAASVDGANRLLLTLDNLEQLGDDAAPLVARLLTEVPALTILATSRQPLRIPGEQELPLGPLTGTVANGKESTRNELPDDMRLFVDRARLVRPDFTLTEEGRSVVARLCALLEGVPLAIELAAAWIRVATPTQIVDRLSDRFRLLATRGAVKANDIIPLRHQSLHATIAWSYDLLEPDLQTFFVRLSVFHGGWTAEAARAVTDAEDAHEPLLLLTERSLIQFEESGESGSGRPPRYRMLESLRAFADEQISPQERASLALRHARYFDALSRTAAHPKQAGVPETRPLLPNDRENLYAAVLSGLEKVGENLPREEHCIHSLRIVLQSSWLWALNEMDALLTLALAALPRLSDETRRPLEASLLLEQGTNALQCGDFEAARRCLMHSREIYETLGDRTGAARAKRRLANRAYDTGDVAGAIDGWKECLEEARCLGDEPMESALLNNLAVASPDLADRRRFSERAVALNRRYTPNSYLLASSLNTLANAAREQRDYVTALRCLEEAYPLACADGASGTAGIVQTSLAELFLETGEQLDRAHDLLSAAEAVFENLGATVRVAEMRDLRHRLDRARGDREKNA